MPANRATCVLADDHFGVADGLARLLIDQIDLVAVARDGIELVEFVRQLSPDIVIADVSMPRLGGLQALLRVRAEGCQSKFILTSIDGEAELGVTALSAGAHGYLLKQTATDELPRAIREVLQGRTYMTPMARGVRPIGDA